MRLLISSFRGRSLITAVAVLGATSAFAAWSASGTVSTTAGKAIPGVVVTVVDHEDHHGCQRQFHHR